MGAIMTLHEIYAELVKRGMPRHPRLKWQPWGDDLLDDRGHWQGNTPVPWAMDESDARDLIVCHAIRWCIEEDVQVDLCGLDEMERFHWLAQNQWLDAILAATSHLAK